MGMMALTPAPFPEFSIERRKGKYFVLQDGEVVSAGYSNNNVALTMLATLQYKAGLVERDCITCRKPFMSEGAHHRMCDGCRRSAGSSDFQLQV